MCRVDQSLQNLACVPRFLQSGSADHSEDPKAPGPGPRGGAGGDPAAAVGVGAAGHLAAVPLGAGPCGTAARAESGDPGALEVSWIRAGGLV